MTQRDRQVAVYAVTMRGLGLAKRIGAAIDHVTLLVSPRCAESAPESAQRFALPMGPLVANTFGSYDAHVFILSVGAAVRTIAPLLRHKHRDPAVVCVDDAGRHCVCVLSGHIGRGNELTQHIASVLGATAVITTASDVLDTLSVDILGREFGWTLDDLTRNVTAASAAVINELPVVMVHEAGEPDFWPLHKPLPHNIAYVTSLDAVADDASPMLLVATHRDIERLYPQQWERSVVYRPKSLVLGIGCDRNTPLALIERGLRQVFERHGLSDKCVRAMATIDKKADEPALQELSRTRAWPLHCFDAAALSARTNGVGVQNPSERVQRFVGTPGVCEPAALLAAGADGLLVSKQRYTEPGAGRTMTAAIAELPFDRRVQEAST